MGLNLTFYSIIVSPFPCLEFRDWVSNLYCAHRASSLPFFTVQSPELLLPSGYLGFLGSICSDFYPGLLSDVGMGSDFGFWFLGLFGFCV